MPLLFSDGTNLVDLAYTPSSSSIFRGQRAAADAPGPEPDPTNFVDGSITTFETANGTELAPLGSGRWICVDAAAGGGGDGKSWATAFDTIDAARAIATTAGDVVVIKNGTYREAVQVTTGGTEAAPIRYVRYGSHTPRVTGSEELTGWAACTSQADALGSPQWANCYKAFVPAGDVMGTTGDGTQYINGILLGLMQDQVKLRLAIDAPGFTDGGLSLAEKQDRGFNRTNTSWYYSSAGSSVSPGSGEVTITNSTALGSRTSAGLTHAWLIAHYTTGNNIRHLKITSFNEGTDAATCKDFYGDDYNGSVAILNAGEDLINPGFWVFSDSLEGDGTRKVVVYPYDGVDLTSTGTIEYCKRGHAFTPGDRPWVTIYGIDADGMAGTSGVTGNAFGTGLTGWNGSRKTGWVFEECSAVNGASEGANGAGASINSKGDNCAILNCTVREIEGAGINLIGGPEAKTQSRIMNNSVSRVFGSGIRPHSFRQGIIAFNTVFDIQSAHGNGMSIYGAPGSVGGDEILVFGNVIRTGYGIGCTYQDTTNIWFICNDIQTTESTTTYRGLENNSNRMAYDPDLAAYINDGVSVTMNNTCGPLSLTNGNTSGIVAYITGGTDHINLNNVAHGMSDPMTYIANRTASVSGGQFPVTGGCPKWIEFSYNVTTNDLTLGADYLTGRSYVAGTGPDFTDNLPAMAGNVKNTTLSEVYTDVASANYRPIADGPLDGTGLPPASSVNSAVLFPDVTDWGFAAFDLDRDCDGNYLDWSAPPIGAYVVT